jgi:hypothetical protein
MGWHATDLTEDAANQQAPHVNAKFNQYGERAAADRREVDPSVEVETASWSKAGQLDWWVRKRQEWGDRVRGAEVVNAGSELLIFVPRAAHRFVVVIPRRKRGDEVDQA